MSESELKNHRNTVYNDIAFRLMEVGIWDIPDEGIKKFKIMIGLYRDHAREFSGSIYMPTQERYLNYRLYNDKSKRSVAFISIDDRSQDQEHK